MKLTLGTVQFGLNYGVSNNAGQVSLQTVKNILLAAEKDQIKSLDCAAAYGTSEAVLGRVSQSQNFNIITKIPSLVEHSLTCDKRPINLADFLSASLQKLKRDKVETLLLHNADDLITHPDKAEIYQQLQNLKAQGLVKKIGVSVYSPQQLNTIKKDYAIDAVQLPLNILDQRFSQNDYLASLASSGIEIHCRSVFLQGLLLMPDHERPKYFKPYAKQLQQFELLAEQLKCTKLSLALAFVVNNEWVNHIVIGCCSEQQLTEIVMSYQAAQQLSLPTKAIKALASDELALINPSLWCLNDH